MEPTQNYCNTNGDRHSIQEIEEEHYLKEKKFSYCRKWELIYF